VFSAASLLQVAHARNVLTAAGIESELRNQYLAGALGDLPMLEPGRSLWSKTRSNRPALRALEEAGKAPSGAPWTCGECGEQLEPQFTTCWRCGAAFQSA